MKIMSRMESGMWKHCLRGLQSRCAWTVWSNSWSTEGYRRSMVPEMRKKQSANKCFLNKEGDYQKGGFTLEHKFVFCLKAVIVYEQIQIFNKLRAESSFMSWSRFHRHTMSRVQNLFSQEELQLLVPSRTPGCDLCWLYEECKTVT